jgi:hypothetical protein
MKLLRSRKFLTLCLDFFVSLVTYFAAKYLAPALAEDILFIIGGAQPVVLAVIVMWGVEDAALKRANGIDWQQVDRALEEAQRPSRQ